MSRAIVIGNLSIYLSIYHLFESIHSYLFTFIVGGTGATGKELIKELIKSSKISHITSLVRRKDESVESDKLDQVVIDFERMSDHQDSFKGNNVAFCCLGTTRKQAGSAENFEHIELGYSSEFSKLAKQENVDSMHLLTSGGANANSWFLYMRVKGQIEEAMKKDQFNHLSVYRPGMLDRGQSDRMVEKILVHILPTIHVNVVAKGMLKNYLNQLDNPPTPIPSFNIIGHRDLFNLAKQL
ncbi:putative transcription coactivator [Cavenderia fasciculata]|uniref:Transcription coactivator n=1 Tax=Cavenderia fasciculata TaxID=261658 RepID=F4PSM9_CACFS|nr:putative transcription coactivator [Cavenderia fasciculata]EGG20721.1 putative transcription coactivator [Cavenderia fasciculata]|eukprot:XP_004358571.1 putative transcription coactivator [Cavenderia fasciculata]